MSTRKKIKLKKTGAGSEQGQSHTAHKRVAVPAARRHASTTRARGVPRPGGRRKKKSNGKGIVLGVFLSVLGVAALYGIYKYVEMKRIEARREAFALAGARDRCDARMASIAPMIAATEAYRTQAENMVADVKEAVAFVAGAPLRPPPEQPGAKAPDANTETPPAAANAPAREAPRPSGPAPPPRPKPPSRRAGHERVGDREAPEGIMSLAELRATRAAKEEDQEQPPPADADADAEDEDAGPAADEAEADPPPPPAPPPPPPSSQKPRVVVIGQQMLKWQDLIEKKLADMRALEDEADTLRDAAYHAALSVQASEKADAIEKVVAGLENDYGYVASVIDEMQAATEEARTIRARVDRGRKARAEEERRREQERRHKALVKRERERAVELHDGVVDLLKQYAFKEAFGELEYAKRSYKTDEGKRALQVYIDRCTRLLKLKQTIIQRLNEQPFRWGWGLGAITQDVLGADGQVVKVRGEDPTPWRDVSIGQMKKFIAHYAKNKAEKISWRAEMHFAAAILLHEHGIEREAREYAREAWRLGAFLREDIARLLPDYQ